ncbi:hypothetical protein NQ317_008858 [Molorchus minor]|uniref:RNase H type-1 domain-containing protein n=1 Tax=Molorchus minor TaxID=1323400 RepID=A0ABQ9JYS8_9CUCU|nr:hypothetical protein NQ317_008858 [Molorchus minor]
MGIKRNCATQFERTHLVHRWAKDQWQFRSGNLRAIFLGGAEIFPNKYATVFQAEILFICVCAQENLRKGAQNQYILILSDSQATPNALDPNKISSKLVWDCRLKLQWLATTNRVKLRWISGHSGLEGNERADSLARQGSELGLVGPEPLVAISKELYVQSISKWIIEQHVEY